MVALLVNRAESLVSDGADLDVTDDTLSGALVRRNEDHLMAVHLSVTPYTVLGRNQAGQLVLEGLCVPVWDEAVELVDASVVLSRSSWTSYDPTPLDRPCEIILEGTPCGAEPSFRNSNGFANCLSCIGKWMRAHG